VKIKIITPDPLHAEAWTALLRSERSLDVSPVIRALRDVNVLVNGSRPDLVLVETTTPQDFEALEALAGRHPEVDYVLVGNELSPDFLMRAMRCGVREVLPAPASDEAVLAALRRQQRKRAGGPDTVPQHHGEVLALLSCKGGSGATFVAANLAHMLADGGRRRVALIDMNLQFGDAALFVTSERPPSNVAEVARNIQRLDPELLQSAMTQVDPGLWVLPSPEDPAQAGDVTPEHVHAMIDLARGLFDHIVIDAGRSLSAVTLQALDLSDRIYAVLQLTLPFIRDGKRLRGVFHSLDYPEHKVGWIVNRYQKDSQLTLDDLKRTLDISQAITLPNQYDVAAASVNQGVPLDTIAPNSPLTRSLRELANSIAPRTGGERAGGWLAGLLRSGPARKAGKHHESA
jgi:pilus assembly protein CpaE